MMRTALCVVMLAVCLVALQCTAVPSNCVFYNSTNYPRNCTGFGVFNSSIHNQTTYFKTTTGPSGFNFKTTFKTRIPQPERQPQPAAPEPTAPEPAAPETTAPETTAPETTAPETTAPETTAPEPAAPESAAPETTAPRGAAPAPPARPPVVAAPATTTKTTTTVEPTGSTGIAVNSAGVQVNGYSTAQVTPLSKVSNILQEVDKNDGSIGSSLCFTLATLFLLAVMAATPAD